MAVFRGDGSGGEDEHERLRQLHNIVSIFNVRTALRSGWILCYVYLVTVGKLSREEEP